MKPEFRSQRSEVGARASVLECGGAPPLSPRAGRSAHRQSASGLAQSKTCRLALAFCLLTSVFCLQALGQSYSIDWWTVDGGGGTSTGGVYTVSGTIGQPDAGPPAHAGGYTLQGGFWGIIAAVQTPGAPLLSILRTTTNTVAVSWPLPAEGWVLEWTNALPQVSAPWLHIDPPYQTNGANLQFIEPTPVGNAFYRLHKP